MVSEEEREALWGYDTHVWCYMLVFCTTLYNF